ncbi:MAG: hypothetical protein HY735_07765 [Verrucomicrobia bacterium]|nr:hypothetical protein [Verrucomicrobiota bacterium]
MPGRTKKIKRVIIAAAGGTAVALGFAMAGLLGLALVLVPSGFALLAMGSERVKRRLRQVRDFLRNQPTTERAEACSQKES